MTPEDLVELELIKRLKYRYLRSIDQKLWDSLESCFVPEATARYGGFLRASLPPFWATTDPAVARDALRRLAAQTS